MSKTPENERAGDMSYEFRQMPNLRYARQKAATEAGADVVPEPDPTTEPTAPSGKPKR